MEKSEDIKELAIALCMAQSKMPTAKKTTKGHYGTYTELSEIISISKQPLFDNGLSYCQLPMTDNELVGVETILMHKSGQWLSNKLLMKPTRQDPQAYGSVLSYAKRYSLQSILGISSEDDDGQYSSDKKSVNKITNSTPKKESEYDDCSCGTKKLNDAEFCYKCAKTQV